jgi:3'-5' exoribonuclease
MTATLRDDSVSHMWVKDITPDKSVRGSYLVEEKRVATTRKGDVFISMTLADRTGEVEAKVWEGAEELSSLFHQGDIIEVDGIAGSYRGQTQVRISGLKVLKGEVDQSVFLESAPVDVSEMMKSLREILKDVKGFHLRSLIDRFLGDPGFVSLFKKAPAAKNFHHNYLGGLLEHTLSVCQMARQVTQHYPNLDRDLLVTAAFLHDLGKIRELKFNLQIDYTDEGRLLGHLVLGATMVDRKLGELRDFPRELAIRLKHLILSHHGQYEFGSPKRPKFLEAFALHLIDDLDAKINGIGRFMEKDLQEGAWTDFNRMFERYFLKGEIVSVGDESKELSRTEEKQGTLFST